MIDPARILAIAPNWLGDAVMVTPALRAVHRRFPDARLEVVGPGGAVALLDGLPWIHALHAIPARAGLSTWRNHAAELCNPRPDLALVFPHSFRAALFARWTGARRRVGQARNARAWLLTDAVPPHRDNGRIAPTYMVDEYLTLAKAVAAEPDGNGPELRADATVVQAITNRLNQAAPEHHPHINQPIPTGHSTPPGHSERSEESLSANTPPPAPTRQATENTTGVSDNSARTPIVGIAPGAAWGPSKRWPAERYAAVADRLHEELCARCVLLTGPGEEDTRAAVQRAARHPLLEIDDGRPSIATLKAAVSLLDVLVCNDSGPRHVAIAFNVPTVCIMGPTRPVYSTGPYERGALLRVDVDCGPCQRPTCRTDHRCMTRITPEAVADAARNCLCL